MMEKVDTMSSNKTRAYQGVGCLKAGKETRADQRLQITMLDDILLKQLEHIQFVLAELHKEYKSNIMNHGVALVGL